ncbi:MAG: hypothetical protein KIS67_00135 [Verrucomicrobiae bacterium]|nr:hypothetical protein [Verrucomicrobiae bacterium]
MTILQPSELKAETDRVLDEALKKPQYVERAGSLLVITRAEVMPGVPFRPEGYFADAHDDAERAARERQAFAATQFHPER